MDEKAKSAKLERQKTEENLKNELKDCQKLRDEYLAGWQRAKADYLNYKKDEAKRMREIAEFGQADLILSVLEVFDNLEKAGVHSKDEGILLIISQFAKLLERWGLKVIEAENKQFNPQFHEAVEHTESEKEKGLVVEVVQKGYMLNGRLLRPAKVKVSKGQQ